ncbi:MAG: I78 family peptidase inhibitor [Pseudomonadota bacterium]
MLNVSHVLVLAGMVVLAGCTSSIRPFPEVTGAPGGDACGAAEFSPLIGQQFTVLTSASLPEKRRVLFPGAVVTEDNDPERLNITIGTDDNIAEVYCG